ncbi:hypothetical protein ACP70R_030941 [Stipagrostis hirtigluma subsp. patula]
MEKEKAISRSPMAKPSHAGGHGKTAESEAMPGVGGSGVASRQKATPEERAATMRFLQAAFEDTKQYAAMTEEEVEDEYRRAGKLHTYDPDKEWKKRYARVAKAYPPPKLIAPRLEEYFKYLEEDEDDYRLGLCCFLED